MIRSFTKLISLTFIIIFSTNTFAQNKLSRYEIKHLLRHKIAEITELAESPKIISAVKQRNTQKSSLESIIKIDKAWKSYPKNHPLKKQMHEGEIGHFLKETVEFKKTIYSEIFLTDNQGANITAWPLTSDYWQGDEAKWSQAFNHGKGEVFIGKLEFDESSDSNAVQISVPVMDNNRAIGVLVAGVKLTYLQAKFLNANK